MRPRKRALVLAVGAGALALVGSAAFTNSLGFSNPNTHVAYGQENVSGATVTSITYGLSADGTTVNSVTFVATGDTSGSVGDVGFTTGGGNQPVSVCATGVYDGTTATTYSCTGLSQSVSAILATDIVVH